MEAPLLAGSEEPARHLISGRSVLVKQAPAPAPAVATDGALATKVMAAWRRSEIWFSTNGIHTTYVLVFWLLNLGLFLQGVRWVFDGFCKADRIGPPAADVIVTISRGAGRMLLFNCALILLPMTRMLSDFLRKTRLSIVLPVDRNVDLHKYVGLVVAVSALEHGFGMLVVYILRWDRDDAWWGAATGTFLAQREDDVLALRDEDDRGVVHLGQREPEGVVLEPADELACAVCRGAART